MHYTLAYIYNAYLVIIILYYYVIYERIICTLGAVVS